MDSVKFDVIVIGGGHAGTEAAAVSARRGARTALVSFDLKKLGAMSCNPAIGGLGKGHLVREVDAFDGLIGRAADAAAIHYRMLNRSKGKAVQGPRIQADRMLYARAIQQMLKQTGGLTLIEGEADGLILDRGVISGVQLADGRKLAARSVVLGTGTFLGGRIFHGEERGQGGRIGERAATRLGHQLRDMNLPMARLKTGTPPRIDGRTIDWSRLDEQPSDGEDWTMSPVTARRHLPQLFCALTRTGPEAHDIIRGNLHRSPLFTGAIEAAGPRYCPSIEDKIHRFGDRDGHQIFLEPEGLNSHLVYPNGISTSLPTDVQQAMIATVEGMERAQIVVPGYAVEYDHIDPRALDATLTVRAMPGLFCAGQINGTTGYEEAAGQGLVAGANAAAYAIDVAPLILDRATSYLGVMIDDLVIQGITEPYRMLTARAEYRLHLRADNAESRLSPIAESLDCLTEERRDRVQRRRAQLASIAEAFQAQFTPMELKRRGLTVAQDGVRRTAETWLQMTGVTPESLLPEVVTGFPADIVEEFSEDARYAPYLERQAQEVAEMRRQEAEPIPADFDFAGVAGLSNEMVERLTAAQPTTLGAASRIRGVTPAAVTAILLHKRRTGA